MKVANYGNCEEHMGSLYFYVCLKVFHNSFENVAIYVVLFSYIWYEENFLFLSAFPSMHPYQLPSSQHRNDLC